MSLVDIKKEMLNNGFNPPDHLELDGKIHRFGENDVDWYCGHQNIISTGETFYVVQYKSWKSSEKFTFKSGLKLDKHDSARLKSQCERIGKAEKRDDDERHERVSAECMRLWHDLEADGIIPYLQGKQLEGLFGAKTQQSVLGRILYIPLRDETSKIWSFQKIFPGDYKKQFITGGRKQGCFHVIGGDLENEEIIYIAEGFATAASVHLAIRKSAVVAFDSGNLLSVSLALKNKYPDKMFVICGDDDVYTENNPGREKAESAAKSIQGSVVFPVFKSPQKGLTDFNDMHCSGGIQSVREQIDKTKPVKTYIIPLGYDGPDYYLLSDSNPQIQKMNSSSLFSASGLCRVQPQGYWESKYPAQKGDGVSWTRAGSEIISKCHERGVFTLENVRGSGFWVDSNETIFHMGDKLNINGSEQHLHKNSLKSKHIYELGKALKRPVPNSLSIKEAHDLYTVARHIRWQKPDSAKFFAGWLALAPIGGALAWRPHIWITGPSGSGKSYVMQEIVRPVLGDYSHFFRGQTTEAGIRQTTGRSSLPVIFDEFETNDWKSSERIKSILELARQASSESDGVVAKGSTTGIAQEFKPVFAMMVASVRINLIHEEDQNRFAVLELARGELGDQNGQFDTLIGLVNSLGPEYGNRLFARSLKLAPVIRQSAEILKREIAKKYPMRTGQQYGALLAGFWSLCSDSVISESEAENLIETTDLSIVNNSVDRNDEMECLTYLLDKIIPVEIVPFGASFPARVNKSIKELINDYGDDSAYALALQQNGICRIDSIVYFIKNHRSLKEFYRGSKWENNYGDQLSRIMGAVQAQPTFALTKDRRRCVGVETSIIQ